MKNKIIKNKNLKLKISKIKFCNKANLKKEKLSKKNENVLKAIIKSFTDLGYTIDVKVLSAHHYGVPEKRRRTIFLGNRFGVKNI